MDLARFLYDPEEPMSRTTHEIEFETALETKPKKEKATNADGNVHVFMEMVPNKSSPRGA